MKKFIVVFTWVQLCFVSMVIAQTNDTNGATKDMQAIFNEAKADTARGVSYKKNMDSVLLTMVHENDGYNRFSNMHLQRSLSWQFYSSIFIFFMVIFIVGFGLYLSFKQFKISEKIIAEGLRTKQSETISKAVDDVNKLLRGDFEVSKDSIKVNSAVVGLIILLISLGFFFLYLKYVYKIEVLNPLKPN